MKYGSVCSGIEAASVAWHSLGWEAQWYSEIEHFPSEVLKHRFPDVPNLGDMTQLTLNPTFNEKSIDLLVGGTPCQSFSVAGLRGGLADPRGNLMLTFLALADAKKPKWIVWENVPGVLSSNGGRDFGTFLGALGELGYGFAYRVLDAQHFGVAQRRRRVFVVGYLGDWRPAAAVLFESESLQRDSKPSRAKRQETPTDAEGSIGTTGNPKISNALCARDYKGPRPEADQGAPVIIEQVAQPIAVDTYNYTTNANVSQTLRSEKSDTEHIGAILHPIPVLAGEHPKKEVTIDVCPTLPAAMGMGGGHTPLVPHPIAVDCFNQTINEKTSQTIGSSASDVNHYGAVLEPTIIDRAAFNQGQNAQYEPRIEAGETMSSLVAKGPHAVAQPIAFDTFNQTTSNINQTIKSPQGGVNESIGVVAQPIAFKIRGGCEGGGKGYLGQEEQAFTISTMQDQQIAQPIAVDTYNYTTNDHTTQTIRSQSDTEHIGAVLQPIAVDVYNQSIDGQTSATITEAVGGTNTSGPKVMHSMAIRRLTPKECERLQGFPDDWTKIPYRNKEADQCPDGPRYKACGNSMAVPVMRWIGQRIQYVENLMKEL
jgi:DNA-cytosine methyltransferase